MNHVRTLQVALACLQALDRKTDHTLSPSEISRQQGIPLRDCVLVIERLCEGGILTISRRGRAELQRHLEDITSLELLQVLWTTNGKPDSIRMLFGGNRGWRAHVTADALQRAAQDQGKGLHS